MAFLKKNVVAAAKAVGKSDRSQDIWTEYSRNGREIRDAFIVACGYATLEEDAVEANARAQGARAALEAGEKTEKPALAEECVRVQARAEKAQNAWDRARKETDSFLEALAAAERPAAPENPGFDRYDEESAKNLEAIERIAPEVRRRVVDYKAGVLKLTGKSAEDNPDRLVERVGSVLAAAREDRNAVRAAINAADRNAVSEAAERLLERRTSAEAIFDEADQLLVSFEEKKKLREAKAAVKEQSWLRPRLVVFGLLGASSVLALIAWVLGLWPWLPMSLVVVPTLFAIGATGVWAAVQPPPAGRSAAAVLCIFTAALVVGAAVIRDYNGDGDANSVVHTENPPATDGFRSATQPTQTTEPSD